MSAVTYTTAGEHDYVLREVGAGTTHNGVTFDGKSDRDSHESGR